MQGVEQDAVQVWETLRGRGLKKAIYWFKGCCGALSRRADPWGRQGQFLSGSMKGPGVFEVQDARPLGEIPGFLNIPGACEFLEAKSMFRGMRSLERLQTPWSPRFFKWLLGGTKCSRVLCIPGKKKKKKLKPSQENGREVQCERWQGGSLGMGGVWLKLHFRR